MITGSRGSLRKGFVRVDWEFEVSRTSRFSVSGWDGVHFSCFLLLSRAFIPAATDTEDSSTYDRLTPKFES